MYSRRRSFCCGRRLLYRHGMDKQSRAASLLRALRRSSWSSGAWSPPLPDGRGLSTHDTAASAVVDASLRPLAGLRVSGGFGYLDAPPAFFLSSSSPPWARSIGCSWAMCSRRRSCGCGRRLLYRHGQGHGMDKQSQPASLLRAFGRSSWSSGAWSPYSS